MFHFCQMVGWRILVSLAFSIYYFYLINFQTNKKQLNDQMMHPLSYCHLHSSRQLRHPQGICFLILIIDWMIQELPDDRKGKMYFRMLLKQFDLLKKQTAMCTVRNCISSYTWVAIAGQGEQILRISIIICNRVLQSQKVMFNGHWYSQ